MVPLALSITAGAVTPQRRGWAIGLLCTTGTSLLVLGPVAGGALVAVDWRLLFVANLPVVAFSAVAAVRCIDGSRKALPHPTDWRMVALLLFGLTGLVVGLVEIADLGPWGRSPWRRSPPGCSRSGCSSGRNGTCRARCSTSRCSATRCWDRRWRRCSPSSSRRSASPCRCRCTCSTGSASTRCAAAW